MTKSVLLLNLRGIAALPAILCADNAEEADAHGIPLFEVVLAQLTAGKEKSPNGNGFDLFEGGQPIGALEIFEPAAFDGPRHGAQDLAAEP